MTVVAASCSSTPSSTGQQHDHDGERRPRRSARRTSFPPQRRAVPVTGGTLKIVGSGDVDHLDTCCAYYTTTYELLRAVSRQLVSYQTARNDPAPTTPVPDMATYSISPNGLTYTFKIKQGVMWDAPTGARQVTSQDEVLGTQEALQPRPPRSAARLLGRQHRRHEVVLHRVRQRSSCRRARSAARSPRSRTTSTTTR